MEIIALQKNYMCLLEICSNFKKKLIVWPKCNLSFLNSQIYKKGLKWSKRWKKNPKLNEINQLVATKKWKKLKNEELSSYPIYICLISFATILSKPTFLIQQSFVTVTSSVWCGIIKFSYNIWSIIHNKILTFLFLFLDKFLSWTSTSNFQISIFIWKP